MIQPTVGRVIWYWPALPGDLNRPELIEDYQKNTQPHAAIVTYVHPDRPMVNLIRFSPDGIAIPQPNVLLVQDDDAVPTHGGWASWMPYQKGQAAKTEQAERDRAAQG